MHTPQRNKNNPQTHTDIKTLDHKCVCQICTCGKHHCPPQQTKFIGQTTNHHDFKAYKIVSEDRPICQHEYKQRHYDQNLIKSSYKQDYSPYKIQKRQQQKSRYQYRPNNQPFYGDTEYNKSYVPNQIKVQRPQTCNHEYQPNRGKFYGTTSYQAQYNQKPLEKSRAIKPEYTRRNIKFQGQSTYNSEFKPHQIQIQRPPSCNHKPNLRSNRFQGQSRYRQEYKPYEMSRCNQCPILQMPMMPRNCSPGKTHLNYSAEKNHWE